MTLILVVYVCVFFFGGFFCEYGYFFDSHGSHLFRFGQNCQNGSVYAILCLQSLDIFVGNICHAETGGVHYVSSFNLRNTVVLPCWLLSGQSHLSISIVKLEVKKLWKFQC
jgi:hypothetical protein